MLFGRYLVLVSIGLVVGFVGYELVDFVGYFDFSVFFEINGCNYIII